MTKSKKAICHTKLRQY